MPIQENEIIGKLTVNKYLGLGKYECTCGCGNTVIMTENEVRSQENSKACSRFRGESCAADLFDELGLEYVTQKKFPDSDLTFDFYLPQLNVVIESDGAQHWRTQNNDWKSETKLQETLARDIEKTQYCIDHDIILLRVCFWDKDKLNIDYFKKIINSL